MMDALEKLLVSFRHGLNSMYVPFVCSSAVCRILFPSFCCLVSWRVSSIIKLYIKSPLLAHKSYSWNSKWVFNQNLVWYRREVEWITYLNEHMAQSVSSKGCKDRPIRCRKEGRWACDSSAKYAGMRSQSIHSDPQIACQRWRLIFVSVSFDIPFLSPIHR